MTVPSCPGLLVTFAVPASVVIIAPFTIMFLLTKCLFAGHSATVLISVFVYFFVFGSRTFAYCATRTFIFLASPFVLITFTCCFPIFVRIGSLPISYFRLPLSALYLPPEGFIPVLPRCTTTIVLLWRLEVFKKLSV